MAEQKYHLLLSQCDQHYKIKRQPWYCERLNAKYKKKHLSTKSWTFVKEGLDDCCDKVKSAVSNCIAKEPSEVQNVNVKSKENHIKTHCFSKDETIYLKALPRLHKNRERLKAFEKELPSHPLVFYSGIEESLPPELFEDLVKILDPSLNFIQKKGKKKDFLSNISVSEDGSMIHPSVSHLNKIDAPVLNEPCSGYNKAIQAVTNNLSKLKAEEHFGKEEKNRVKGKKMQLNQLSKIEIVTKDFCDWVHNLGGEANNISETKINELFASSCEAKPTLSIPVQVLELTTVPSELCVGGQYPLSSDTLDYDALKPVSGGNLKKIKYGAWYLDPKTWKPRLSKEPLCDPNEASGTEVSLEKMKSEELNKLLSSLHGVKVFREFVEKKGVRNPEFLKDVPLDTDDEAANSDADRSK